MSEAHHGPRAAYQTCKGCPALTAERWREPSGDGETYDSGTYNKCGLKGGKVIDGAYGHPEVRTPGWCPALATQPEPGAVPELPEWVEFAGADAGWRIGLEGPPGRNAWLETSWCESPDDLDRIAEACTKLAARERARRAGS